VDAPREAPEPEPADHLPGPAAGPLLRIDGLVKDYTVTSGAVLQHAVGKVSAVADVSFSVPRGSVFGLVGESGCGKTTIGRLIAGLEKATGGEITFDDDGQRPRWRAQRRRARQVQPMFQDSYAAMDPRMRVGTILREPLAIQGIGSRAEQRQRVAQILDEVGLSALSSLCLHAEHLCARRA
jgi:peptide/nickel transport system ATP-binding protein